ncbi:MAG: hypothetical protein J1G01_01270 [Clostridiales bacterium]|nr:hypothetical protein [Clostridiales bacterium]
MDLSVLILQVVTILISVSSLVFNLIITTRENNKKQYVKVVTAQRLSNKEIIRDNVRILLSNSNAYALRLFDEQTLKQCVTSAAAIETVLKTIYNEDNAVLVAVNELIKELAAYLDSENNAESVQSARQNLFNEYSVYDLSDWRFIKKQAHGNSYDSADFIQIYDATRKEYFIEK